jgi:hypothetical protein
MTAILLSGSFKMELQSLRATYLRILRAQTNGHLTSLDLDYTVESLALHAYSSFELFMSDLFVESISNSSGMKNVRSYLNAPSMDHARDIVYGDEKWLDWLPLSKTCDRADRYLEYGQPFVRLRLRSLQLLDLMRIVRNRIAHRSEEALKAYARAIIKTDKSLAQPSRWLQHKPAGLPNDHFTLILALMEACCAAVTVDAPALDSIQAKRFCASPWSGTGRSPLQAGGSAAGP